MAAREHVLDLAGEATDTAAARHSDDDFSDVSDLVRTTSANLRPPKSWHQSIIVIDIHISNYGYP